MKVRIQIHFFILLLLVACQRLNPVNQHSRPISHQTWNTLLNQYVDHEGIVDYIGLKKDEAALDQYLKQISTNAPNSKHWSKEDQLAYWINAYNAFTIKLILDHYPIKSIKDIGPSLQIPFVNTPWQMAFITIGEKNYNLDNLEHNIIRKNFEEPRIHFALVCAAISCPKLRNEAYTGEQLEKQLADQTKYFLENKYKNDINETQVKVSRIFKWYRGDFTKKGSLIDFLNQYSSKKIEDNADIEYMDYNWSLNSKTNSKQD